MDILNKALLVTTTDSGAALIPQDLEPAIIEYLGKEMPLWTFVGKAMADAKTHEYTVRTAVPAAWVEGELSDGSAASSTNVRRSVQLKIVRTWGGVSGFQQKMSEKFINALETEITGSVEGMAEAIEFLTLWGNDVDTYQFDGIDAFILNDSTARLALSAGGNVLDINAVGTLTHLDNMIDRAEGFRGARSDPKMFLMSRQAISYVTGLQTKIQRTVQAVEFEGGFRMETYRGIPLMPTDFTRPLTTTTSPAVTATKGAGGSLADDEYFYRISSVTLYGEQLVGAEDSATTETTNNSVVLTWTADANAKLYRIWRGTATGADNMTLLATIAAKGYASDGDLSTDIATWTDDGSLTAVATYVPLSAGEECVFLINLNTSRGVEYVGSMSPLGERTDNFISYVPLATTKSAFQYLIEGFMALKIAQPETCVIARRFRLTA